MQKIRHLFVATVSATALLIPISLSATLPTVSPYNCQGSLKPYPAPETLNTYPDSLTPVFINHVGRHGARYPAGSAHALGLMKLLNRADSLKTITPLGRQLKAITAEVIKQSTGRWGALDSLGMAEHRGIASRMVKTFPTLFKGKNINAISSYSPRAMMSMFSFVHEIDDLNNSSEISTLTGRSTSPLMRFFDVNQSYITFIKDKTWEKPYKEYIKQTIP
ncbi:MAG: histidine phosphatase family protein, partial [Muribaculaceae bacterium]|nr:histidine phosphatase family protein [Muribaculaceae bacterium]